MEPMMAALLGLFLFLWIIYYIVPLKIRWGVLLVVSLLFVCTMNPWKSTIYMLFTIGVVYISATAIEKCPKLVGNIAFGIGMLFCLSSMLLLNTFRHYTHITGVLAPLGISYYSFSLMSYLIDVRRQVLKREKNPLRLVLYGSMAPTLISGPILRFNEIAKSIFDGNKLNVRKIYFGIERILFGLFKKMVISDRIAVIVNAVFADFSAYRGTYIAIAFLLFPIQLYTDFSGCIDIVMGIAELFGIDLPENFHLPFLSGTVAEFWRRWHITLGSWLRDYIFYPILRSKWVRRCGKWLKKYGVDRNTSMKHFTRIALLITWICIGIWHKGTWPSIFGVGLFFGLVIVLGEMLEPVWKCLCRLLHINREGKGFQVFRVIRTYLLFATGNSFFRQQAGLREGFHMWKNLFTTWNPQVLVDGSLLHMGLDLAEWTVLLIALALLILAGILRARTNGSLREWLDHRNVVLQYAIVLGLLAMIMVWGWYGEGYAVQQFIYQQF